MIINHSDTHALRSSTIILEDMTINLNILKDGIALLPVFLIGIMAIVCAGQVILDLRRHPHHRFSKF